MRPPSRHVAAWGLVGACSCVLVLQGRTGAAAETLAVHALLDLGQHLGVGLAATGVSGLYLRFGPKRWSQVGAFGLLGVFACVVAWLVGVDELTILTDRLAPLLGDGLADAVAALALGTTIPITAGLARLVSRGPLGLLPIVGGISLAVNNGLVLPRLYVGLHLMTAWIAATAIAEGLPPLLRWLVSTRVGSAMRERAPRAPRHVGTVVAGALALLGALSLGARPSSKVQVAMAAQPSSVFVPFLATLRARTSGSESMVVDSQWFKSRKDQPAIPPSRPAVTGESPIVMLVIVDCLRADLLRREGFRPRFPNMWRLRDQSVEFTVARAPGPATAASIAAIFSGRYYSQLYWTPLRLTDKLRVAKGEKARKPFLSRETSKRFPELLQDGGVRTFLFSGIKSLGSKYGLTRGYDVENDTGFRVIGTEITDQTIDALENDTSGPSFFYVHYIDAHAPYDLGGTKGSERERYLREVEIVDGHVGRLLQAIDSSGLADRTTILLTGDHGEAFGEHNTKTHATTLYEELLRVPLLIRSPEIEPRQVHAPVSLVDVGPTVLDLMHQPTPGEFMGQTLVPFLRDDDDAPALMTRPLIAESSRAMRALYLDDGLKIIENRKLGIVEVYDLRSDPKEARNIYDEEEHREALGRLRAFFEEHELRKEGYETPYRR